MPEVYYQVRSRPHGKQLSMSERLSLRLLYLAALLSFSAGCDEGKADRVIEPGTRVATDAQVDLAVVWRGLLSSDESALSGAVQLMLDAPLADLVGAYVPVGLAWRESSEAVAIDGVTIEMSREALTPVIERVDAAADRLPAPRRQRLYFAFEALMSGIARSTESTPAVIPWLVATGMRIGALEAVATQEDVAERIESLNSSVRERVRRSTRGSWWGPGR